MAILFFHDLLKKYIEPIQLYTWNERVNRLCNEPYTFRYLVEKSKNQCPLAYIIIT